jgi:hypothetical protein
MRGAEKLRWAAGRAAPRFAFHLAPKAGFCSVLARSARTKPIYLLYDIRSGTGYIREEKNFSSGRKTGGQKRGGNPSMLWQYCFFSIVRYFLMRRRGK